jgi:hypothetical protein
MLKLFIRKEYDAVKNNASKHSLLHHLSPYSDMCANESVSEKLFRQRELIAYYSKEKQRKKFVLLKEKKCQQLVDMYYEYVMDRQQEK